MKRNGLKLIFLQVLSRAQDRYAFDLVAYQIMDNHIHLVIKTVKNGAPISRIMQFIKARFAEKYNRMHNRCGPFWNERYRDSIIERARSPEVYLLWLLWYLAFNPVRKNRSGGPRQYAYGSIHCYLDEAYIPPVRITLHEYYLKLAGSFEERLKKFLAYEDAYRRRLAMEWD